ncbi:O-antigen ligase family protein [Bdellovibrio sp. HCB288]|uniref:O-antigen ligase family protein n=1 Tax=Bdellovibrio sp. HCB288 TaxID=3394355 RepID=UPI0039B429F3
MSIFEKLSKQRWNILAIALFFSVAVSWRFTDVCFVLLIATVLFDSYRDGWKSLRGMFSELKVLNILVIVFVLANLLGYLTATEFGPRQIDEMLSLRWILSFYACVYMGRKLQYDKVNVDALSIVYVVLLLFGVCYQYFLTARTGRLEGFFGNANIFAYTVIIPWAVFLTLESFEYVNSKRNNFFLLAAIVAISVMVFFTQGRGTWLAMAIVFLALSALLKIKRNAFVIVGVAVLALGMYFGNIFGFKDRILYSFDFAAGSAQGVRAGLWRMNWEMFKDHPLFGIGLHENFRMLEVYYSKFSLINREVGANINYINHAHNQLLQVLTGSGIVGGFAYIAIMVIGLKFFYSNYRSQVGVYKNIALAGLFVLVAHIATGLVDCPLMVHQSRSYLLLFSGVFVGALMPLRRGTASIV